MGACMVKEVPSTGRNSGDAPPTSTIIVANTGSELKQNYLITSTSKILGAGVFGKVFLSHNIADPSLQVAIKLFNKTKLERDQI
jgi:hypothetical protein